MIRRELASLGAAVAPLGHWCALRRFPAISARIHEQTSIVILCVEEPHLSSTASDITVECISQRISVNMTDSPAFQAPLDPQEEPILASVLKLRDELSLLQQDRSKYIKSQDIISIYEQVIENVQVLNALRAEHEKPLESNRGRSPASTLHIWYQLTRRSWQWIVF